MTPDEVPDGPLVVDTDVVSYVHARSGRYADVETLLAGHLLAVSFATYAEVFGMGHNARWGKRRMAALRTILARYVVLPYSAAVAEASPQTWPKLRGDLHGMVVMTCGPPRLLFGTSRRFRSSPRTCRILGRSPAAFELVHPDL